MYPTRDIARAEAGRKREGRLSLLGMSPQGRLWVFVSALALLAAVLVAGTMPLIGPTLRPPFSLPWPLVAAAFALAEVFAAHIRLRREAYSFSLSEVPLVIGLYYLSPAALIGAQLLGAGAALAFHRRQPIIKLLFNISALCIEAVIALVVFHAFATGAEGGPLSWLGVVLATIITTTLGVLLVGVAISIATEKPYAESVPRGLGLGVVTAITNTCLALIAVVTSWRDPFETLLLLVPIGVLVLGYRAYSRQQDNQESLELLFEASREAQRSVDLDAAVATLLGQARNMFDAEVASLLIFDDDATSGQRYTLDHAEQRNDERVELDPREGLWARVASEGEALLLARPITNTRLREHLARTGIHRDAMVAPLYSEEGVMGTLTVGDRIGDVSTFDQEDLTLFETLGNHASVILQKIRLVERLTDSLTHLTEMNQLKDDFVAAVSHELRTPLTSIQGYVKTMLRPEAGRLGEEERKSFLVAVEKQSERLRNLIEDLLVVSRLEAHEVTPLLSTVEVRHVVDGVLAELRERTEGRAVRLDIPSDLPRLHTDEGKVFQIVSNLVDNALKYSSPGTPLTLRAASEDDGVVLSLTDEGDGVPVEAQERIFDRFFQADQTSTRATGGTGLGLYICRRLAEALGGRVWLDASGPEGSTFSLWVPRILRLKAPSSV
ncbi:MAG TPA: ATP-binding protein [Actinomycetota bacterium]|nr:ATP-binding protein [Actinomycetota bacterium]